MMSILPDEVSAILWK